VGGIRKKKKEAYIMLNGGKYKAVSYVTTVTVKNQETRLFKGFKGCKRKEDFGKPGICCIIINPAVLRGLKLLILKYLQISKKPLLL